MALRSSRGRPFNAPAAFIHPCQPIVAKQPPSGPGWAHKLKYDGYRLQIHVRNGRVRLFTMNGADWTKRYPRIVEEAARLREPLIIDAEVGSCLVPKALRISMLCTAASRREKPWPLLSIFLFRAMIFGGGRCLSARRHCSGCFVDRAAAFNMSSMRRAHGDKLFAAVCDLGLEGIVSKKITSVYKSGPSIAWIKVKNPKSPAATRAIDGTF